MTTRRVEDRSIAVQESDKDSTEQWDERSKQLAIEEQKLAALKAQLEKGKLDLQRDNESFEEELKRMNEAHKTNIKKDGEYAQKLMEETEIEKKTSKYLLEKFKIAKNERALIKIEIEKANIKHEDLKKEKAKWVKSITKVRKEADSMSLFLSTVIAALGAMDCGTMDALAENIKKLVEGTVKEEPNDTKEGGSRSAATADGSTTTSVQESSEIFLYDQSGSTMKEPKETRQRVGRSEGEAADTTTNALSGIEDCAMMEAGRPATSSMTQWARDEWVVPPTSIQRMQQQLNARHGMSTTPSPMTQRGNDEWMMPRQTPVERMPQLLQQAQRQQVPQLNARDGLQPSTSSYPTEADQAAFDAWLRRQTQAALTQHQQPSPQFDLAAWQHLAMQQEMTQPMTPQPLRPGQQLHQFPSPQQQFNFGAQHFSLQQGGAFPPPMPPTIDQQYYAAMQQLALQQLNPQDPNQPPHPPPNQPRAPF